MTPTFKEERCRSARFKSAISLQDAVRPLVGSGRRLPLLKNGAVSIGYRDCRDICHSISHSRSAESHVFFHWNARPVESKADGEGFRREHLDRRNAGWTCATRFLTSFPIATVIRSRLLREGGSESNAAARATSRTPGAAPAVHLTTGGSQVQFEAYGAHRVTMSQCICESGS